MSSAILYLAIVAIWACVLIPRWLRRDSARGSSHVLATAIPGNAVPGDAVADVDVSAVPAGAARTRPLDAADERPEATDSGSPEQDEAPRPLTPEESRQRMLAARRRLLGMLLALEAAALALAVLGLAALWVVIPPSVMLTGYLLLLREASHADAERARRAREAAWARARTRAEQRAARGSAASAAVAPPAASPVAEYEDAGPGRDFAPGLAGKYIPSNAEVINLAERASEDLYDQHTQNKLRAVGD